MEKLIITSDTHGCFYTLVRLLNQCAKLHPGARLVFLGDLVDRGPNSRQVVEFAMEHKIPTCMGNHEDLCLGYSQHAKLGYKAHCAKFYERDIWLANGGEVALASWERGGTKVMREEKMEGGIIIPEKVYLSPQAALPKEVLDWMQALPAYLILDVPQDENGRELLLSHTGQGLSADLGNWFDALWARDDDFPGDGRFRVFGHTPNAKPVITQKWANIDTGAAYSSRGGGTMTAFIWPTKEIVQQAFDETPAELRFSIEDGRIS